MEPQQQAIVELGRYLRSQNYRFTTVTPLTHERILRRADREPSLTSIFGWNREFPISVFGPTAEWLQTADALERTKSGFKSRIRFSTIDDYLFAHSAYPTQSSDSVFFGPDTYRFIRLVREKLDGGQRRRPVTIIDVGCGSGAGGICAGRYVEQTRRVVLSDINLKALKFAQINAALNEFGDVTIVNSDILANVDGTADIIISNPPYLVDRAKRSYRHGGGEYGVDIALKIVEQGLQHLAPGGLLILYTGTPIIDGHDVFFDSMRRRIDLSGCDLQYEEIDPDVFGEELETPPYDRADRIAVVCATVQAPTEEQHA